MMVVEKEKILDFIPHRAPFVMVDGLTKVETECFESIFFIEAHNILVEKGIFQASGLIENIAQTCAAAFGYLDRDSGEAPKMGFIGAVSKLEIHHLPAVNTTIRTIVIPTHRLGNIFLVAGRCYLEELFLAACEMKIVVSQNEAP